MPRTVVCIFFGLLLGRCTALRHYGFNFRAATLQPGKAKLGKATEFCIVMKNAEQKICIIPLKKKPSATFNGIIRHADPIDCQRLRFYLTARPLDRNARLKCVLSRESMFCSFHAPKRPFFRRIESRLERHTHFLSVMSQIGATFAFFPKVCCWQR